MMGKELTTMPCHIEKLALKNNNYTYNQAISNTSLSWLVSVCRASVSKTLAQEM